MQIAPVTYFYPDSDKWNRVIAIKPPFVLINPNSGPGRAADPNYTELISRVTAAGIRVFGYIPTTWADRPIYDVNADREAYHRFYERHKVTGFFLDEASTDPKKRFYYQAMLQGGQWLILNPGTYPDPSYARLPVTLMVAETDFASYMAKEPPPWVLAESNALRFYHCVFGVKTSLDMREVMVTAKRRNAGLVWITHDVLPNPYDSVPNYLEEMAEMSKSL